MRFHDEVRSYAGFDRDVDGLVEVSGQAGQHPLLPDRIEIVLHVGKVLLPDQSVTGRPVQETGDRPVVGRQLDVVQSVFPALRLRREPVGLGDPLQPLAGLLLEPIEILHARFDR